MAVAATVCLIYTNTCAGAIKIGNDGGQLKYYKVLSSTTTISDQE